MRFRDRHDAGRRLGERLAGYVSTTPVVVGLTRGGIEVAAEVAVRLGAPLDVAVVGKVGHRFQPEFAVGAVAEGGVTVLNDTDEDATRIANSEVGSISADIERRAVLYRRGRAPLDVVGRTVIVVDDGIATGATARAACLAVRARGADHVVLAVPVAPAGWVESMGRAADEYVAVDVPADFVAVGQYYEHFDQLTDDDVVKVLGA